MPAFMASQDSKPQILHRKPPNTIVLLSQTPNPKPRHLWAYKYDERYTGINVHADEAAVNLNFWVTPEDANLDKESGGLVIYTKKPPADWTFDMYNQFAEGGAARQLRKHLGKPCFCFSHTTILLPLQFSPH